MSYILCAVPYRHIKIISIAADVTLDAGGNANSIWIFQIAGGVTQAPATKVNLIGGALAKNVFWQVFGILDIGTDAVFTGVALVQTAINVQSRATVNGRLLAQTAVTLDQATIKQPSQ